MGQKTVRIDEGIRWARSHWSTNDDRVLEEPWRSVPDSDGEDRVPLDVDFTSHDPAAIGAMHSPGSTPIVVRGGAAGWPATTTWSLDWFAQQYGDHEVPTDDREADGSTVVLPLRECIDRTKKGNGGYARFSPLLITNPELTEHLDLPVMADLCGAPMKRMLFQLFLGGANTTTETHCAVGNNIFVQAHGEKIWRFVAPEYSGALRPMPTGRPYFASRATLHDESLVSHPEAPVHEVHLRQGDVLLVPPFWWHQVDNPTESIGVAGRWHHLGHAFSQSTFMSLMTFTARNPNIIKANKDRQRFGYVYQETVDQAGQAVPEAA